MVTVIGILVLWEPLTAVTTIVAVEGVGVGLGVGVAMGVGDPVGAV